MFATLVGAYPRTPLPGQPFRLRAAHGQLERGEMDAAGFRAVQDDLIREIVTEQIDAGLAVVTDGQVRWDDPLTALARGLDGFEITGLLRYFDTNTYYRQPRATTEPRWTKPILVDDYRFTESAVRSSGGDGVRVKQTLPGPYTLARLSDPGELDRRRLALALSDAIHEELRALVDAGAQVVQLDEDALTLVGPNDDSERQLAYDALERATAGIRGADLVLAVTMGAATNAGIERLYELPFSTYLFDLVAGEENWRLIAQARGDRTIICGAADARNTRRDDEGALVWAARYAASLEARGPDRVGLSPSTGLEYLPRDRAREKIRALGTAARKASEAGPAATEDLEAPRVMAPAGAGGR